MICRFRCQIGTWSSRTCLRRTWLALIAAIWFLAPSPASAQTGTADYWDPITTGLWGTSTNWSPNSTGVGGTGVVPTSTYVYDAYFNGTSDYGPTTVQLGTPAAALGLYFTNTGTTLLESSSATPETLSIGADGITVASTAGAVTLGDPLGVNLMPISITGSQTWTNNSTTSALNMYRAISDSVSSTLTIAGAGSTNISGVISDGAGPLQPDDVWQRDADIEWHQHLHGHDHCHRGNAANRQRRHDRIDRLDFYHGCLGETLAYYYSNAFTASNLSVAGNLSYKSSSALTMSGTYGGNQLSFQGANVSVAGALTLNGGSGGTTITGSSASAAGITQRHQPQHHRDWKCDLHRHLNGRCVPRRYFARRHVHRLLRHAYV